MNIEPTPTEQVEDLSYPEALEEIRRYRQTLQAIRDCPLTGVDYGDWVQACVEDALDGQWPECWRCGTAVHDGPCVEAA